MKRSVRKPGLFVIALLMANLFLVNGASAQSPTTAGGYTFVNSSTGSLTSDRYGNTVDMTTGTTQLVAASQDNTASAVTNIGFTFVFCGTSYTQFSASSNGGIRLGSSAISSTLNNVTTSFPVSSQAIIAPYLGDLATSSSGKVHYKLVGSSPTRTLVIEFLNMSINKNSSTADGTFQARLFETSNIIEFVYGSMSVGSTSTTSSTRTVYIGFETTSTSGNEFTVGQTSPYSTSTTTTEVANTNSSTGAISGLTSSADGSRRSFSFGRAYADRFVSMNTGSSTWCPGESRDVTATVQNMGVTTWTNSSPDINIGVKWNTNNGANSWLDYNIRTDVGGLASGAIATYTLPLTASNNVLNTGYTTPLSAGTNNITFDIVEEAISWFGNNGGNTGPGNTVFTSSNITIATPPTTATVGATQNICGGLTSISLGGNTPSSGTGAWSQSSGVGTSTFSNSVSGSSTATATLSGNYNYTWTITTNNGCASSATVAVNYLTLPSASASKTDISCFGSNNGTIVVSGSGGSGTFSSYSINNGSSYQSSNTFNNLPVGSYKVRVKDTNGCESRSVQ